MSNPSTFAPNLEQLSVETGVPVEVLRTFAGISDPANEHMFTAEAARQALGAALFDRGSEEDEVSSNLARMKLPAFAHLARKLEQQVPVEQGFGRFRGALEGRADAEMAFLLARDVVSDEELVIRVQSAPAMGGAAIVELSGRTARRDERAK